MVHLQTGRATRYGAVGAPTGWFSPFRQRPPSLCLNLVCPPTALGEETGNATSEKILCTHTWLGDGPRDVVSRTSQCSNGLEQDRHSSCRKRRRLARQRYWLPRRRHCPGCRL